MVEVVACFFLISFPLAMWVFFAVAKRVYRHRPDDASFLGRLLSAPSGPQPVAPQTAESRSQADSP